MFNYSQGIYSTLFFPLTNSSFSIGLWLYVGDDTSRGGFYEGNYFGSPYNRVILGKFAPGVIHAQVIDTDNNTITITTPQDLNTWIKYDLTYNKDSKTLSFYKNGVLVQNSSNASFNNTFNENSSSGFVLAEGPINNARMNGRFDELRLYTRELSAGEILGNYNSEILYFVTPTVNNTGWGNISPSSEQTVSTGNNSAPFTAAPNSGYKFDYLLINGAVQETTNPYTFTNVRSNQTIQAVFSAAPLNNIVPTVNNTNMGSISPSTVQSVGDGSICGPFTAAANSGYQFDYFLINGITKTTTNPYTFSIVTSSQTIQAVFKIAGAWNLGSNGTDIFYNNGSVLIGKDIFPAGYKFGVAGKMIAEEVDIKLNTDWPDYVFDESYSLRSLEQLDFFIKETGHLPEIPSAKEVKENGISIGEMQIRLLQKIEELTLYLIEIKKENLEFKKKVNDFTETIHKTR